MKNSHVMRQVAAFGLLLLSSTQGAVLAEGTATNKAQVAIASAKISDAEWKKRLSPAQYNVMRQKGTEPPFTGKYNNFYENGIYKCAACGSELFTSKTKFDAHEGWPSFYEPSSAKAVTKVSDNSIPMMPRTEVECAKCGAHLGHVFDDGPKPTGLRYCINSVCLNFDKATGK